MSDLTVPNAAAQGVARLRLCYLVIAGLVTELSRNEYALLLLDNPPSLYPHPVDDDIKRDCIETIMAFHIEALPPVDDDHDTDALKYQLLAELVQKRSVRVQSANQLDDTARNALKALMDEGYVAERGGRIRPTEKGAKLVKGVEAVKIEDTRSNE